MAKISRRRLAQTTVRLLSERPSDRTRILHSVAAYLIVNKQTHQLDLLLKDIARELEISEGVLLAEVQSAFALDDASRGQLKKYLADATQTKQVELEESVDTALLSGVIIRTAQRELDTTARRKLKQLASLNSGGKN